MAMKKIFMPKKKKSYKYSYGASQYSNFLILSFSIYLFRPIELHFMGGPLLPEYVGKYGGTIVISNCIPKE